MRKIDGDKFIGFLAFTRAGLDSNKELSFSQAETIRSILDQIATAIEGGTFDVTD